MNRGIWISSILFASIVLVLFVVFRLFLGGDDREGLGIGFTERNVVGLVGQPLELQRATDLDAVVTERDLDQLHGAACSSSI